MAQGNVYGVQKLEETDVRSDLDMAMGATSAMAQGAQIGSQFGPWGTAAGAVGGLALGVAGQKKGLRLEEERKVITDSQREFVDNLEGRDFRENTLVRAQARYGMNKKGRYDNVESAEVVEIEGDGSGSPNGIGEIHVDKNYNIKNIAKGSQRHEDGGHVVNNLEKDDIIFPTQNSEKEYNRIMGAIKKYKLNGDSRAKKYLDKKRDKLPTDEDYGYNSDTNKEYPDGFKGGEADNPKAQLKQLMETSGINLSRRQLRRMTDTEAMDMVHSFADDPTITAANPNIYRVPVSDENPAEAAADIGKNTQGQTGSVVTGSGSMQQKKDGAPDINQGSAWDVLFDRGKSWDEDTIKKYAEENNLKFTDVSKEAEARGIDIPEGSLGKGDSDRSVNWGPKTAAFFSATETDTTPKVQPQHPTHQPIADKSAVTNTPQVRQYEASPSEVLSPEAQEQFDPLRNGTLGDDGSTVYDDSGNVKGYIDPETGEYTAGEREKEPTEAELRSAEAWEEIHNIDEHNNPLKYASVANKIAKGSEAIDPVERRFYTPDRYEYEDRSASDRRATTEQRNYATQQLRGKGLSVGQQQAYQNQIGSRYLNQMEGINEREAQRQDNVDAQNVALMNQAEMSNLQLANQYDTFDDQAEAARQRYMDEAMSDVSKFAQLDEQKRYMMDRDKKRNMMQMGTVGMVGTGDFGYDPNNPFVGVKYKNYKK